MVLAPEVLVAVRFVHIVAGILWIGPHWFANLVNVPLIASLPPTERARFVATVVPVFLAFRHAAWVTVLAGFVLIYELYWSRGDVVTSDGAKTIFSGMVVGVVMLALVWLVTWPNQRAVVRAAQGGAPPPPTAERNATYGSRATFALSFPLLFFMGASAHFPLGWPAIAVVLLVGSIAGFSVVYGVQSRAMRAVRRA